jgi:ankyrin repeat protein
MSAGGAYNEEVRRALQALVASAAASIVPRALRDRAVQCCAGRSAVHAYQKRANAGDFVCRAPCALFRMLLHSSSSGDASGCAITTTMARDSFSPAVTITTRSVILGIPVVRTYASAADIAAAIIASMPSEHIGELLSDIRTVAAPTCLIVFTTHRHMIVQRRRGMLPCSLCGLFYKGERGMRDHTLNKHRRSYEQSKAAAAESRTAIVPYWRRGDEADAEWVASLQEEVAALNLRVNLASRRALPPGICAARDGDLAEVQRLVREEGWDPNPATNQNSNQNSNSFGGGCGSNTAAATDRHGSCAFMWAAGGGHLELCQWLVSSRVGMDPHAVQMRHKSKRTPLHWAARNGHVDVCRWLVEKCGVDPDARTVDGTSAFHFAVHWGHVAVLRWLVAVRPTLAHAVNAFGCNAVQWAALSGSVDMCVLLLREFEVDFTLLNHNLHSVFHKAAVKGNEEVCRWLVAASGIPEDALAKLLRADKAGNRPSELARLEGHDKLSGFLAGVEVSERREEVEADVVDVAEAAGADAAKKREGDHRDAIIAATAAVL